MKICIVCPRLCHGGAERVAVSLANGFIGRGHEVSFFTNLYEEQSYKLEELVTLVNLVDNPHQKWKKWLCAVKKLRIFIKQSRPDVVIGIMSLCSIVAKLATIGLGIPVVATEHDSYEKPISSLLPWYMKFYKFYLSRIFSSITILTYADKKVIGNRLKNVVVEPNPLSLKPLERLEQRKKVLLAAGRVDNWYYKGFDVLIRAWGRVNERLKIDNGELSLNGEPWKLVIAGVWRNPETRTYLDGIAKECEVLDKVEYTGFVENMQKLYAESSIFVLSSRYEGFGLVLIEAMSQGCACVACDYKGRQREIMSPTQDQSFETRNLNPETRNRKFEACDTGILCEPDDVDSLASGIQKMIEDNEYRDSVRLNAIERSKYYSIENTMDRWEILLKQVIETC